MIGTNIVIPMAGSGQRFRDAGYALPKPLIDVRGKPMIARVMENVAIKDAIFILIARREHVAAQPELFARLQKEYPCRIIEIDALTEGAACTILCAEAFIANDAPLLLANSDQLVDEPLARFIDDAHTRALDGSILTFPEPGRHPKWSYAAVDERGMVTETKEKEAISTHATVGLYWFAKGTFFVEAARDMIARNDRSNNEYYVCPVYNYLIARGLKVGIYEIRRERMHGLGTPEDLQAYLA